MKGGHSAAAMHHGTESDGSDLPNSPMRGKHNSEFSDPRTSGWVAQTFARLSEEISRTSFNLFSKGLSQGVRMGPAKAWKDGVSTLCQPLSCM